MERLTEKTIGCFKFDLKNHEHVQCEFGTYEAFFNYSKAVARLGEYEEIGFTPSELFEKVQKLNEYEQVGTIESN